MKKWMLIIWLPLLVVACKAKKKQLTDDGITVSDFIEFFDDVKPPFIVGDADFEKKKTDTASISYKTFTSLLPDSLLHGVFSKNVKPRIYPLGKIAEKNKETYL